MWLGTLGFFLVAAFHLYLLTEATEIEQPNIVVIFCDDMGFNDVSFHGSNQVVTPNIDALAYNGILLNKHYSPNLCTPSRAAFMTGKFPSHTGTQHSIISTEEPWGLPLKEKLMSEYLKEVGYKTHLIGKWHLGFWQKELTPLYRGFDEHVGYYAGYISYYNHTHLLFNSNFSEGLDFRRNLTPWPEANGIYATEVFTNEAERVIKSHNMSQPLFMFVSHLAPHAGNPQNPLEAPAEEIAKYAYITDPKRRIYAAMLSKLDESVGNIIEALATKGMLNNTIVLLTSDNGALTLGGRSNSGSNAPLRGQKSTPFEGGIRTVGLLWSPLLEQKGYVSQQVVHSVDWFPTLAKRAGITLPTNIKLDGMDVWDILSHNQAPQPRNILHCLDNVSGYSSYTSSKWKYVNGSSNNLYNDWSGLLSANEIDPKSVHYADTILKSKVHSIIGNTEKNLNDTLIRELRSQATVKCAMELNTETENQCSPFNGACLFNIEEDPCEQVNLASLQPGILNQLKSEVEDFLRTAVPPANVYTDDARCDPALHNGLWTWWSDFRYTSSGHTKIINFLLINLVFLVNIIVLS